MSSSNRCFLTCIQISQEAGQVVWYSHLFQNFPVYCDPHSQRLCDITFYLLCAFAVYSISSSNCYLLTYIQISQEAGQVVWYFHLFESFPQSVVIYTVKGFGIINKAEVDFFFWNSPAFWMIQQMLAI